MRLPREPGWPAPGPALLPQAGHAPSSLSCLSPVSILSCPRVTMLAAEPDSARPAEPGRRPHSRHRVEDTTQGKAGPHVGRGYTGRGLWRGGADAGRGRIAQRAAGKLRPLLGPPGLTTPLPAVRSPRPSSLGPVFQPKMAVPSQGPRPVDPGAFLHEAPDARATQTQGSRLRAWKYPPTKAVAFGSSVSVSVKRGNW